MEQQKQKSHQNGRKQIHTREIDSFHRFLELPAELRIIIWNFSISPRRLQVRIISEGPGLLHDQISGPVPSLLCTNAESRAAGLMLYKTQITRRGCAYYNPEIDMFVLHGDNIWYDGHMYKELLSEGGKMVFGLVRNLEIRVSQDKYLLGRLRNEARAWDLNRDRAETSREGNVLSYFTRLEHLNLRIERDGGQNWRIYPRVVITDQREVCRRAVQEFYFKKVKGKLFSDYEMPEITIS